MSDFVNYNYIITCHKNVSTQENITVHILTDKKCMLKFFMGLLRHVSQLYTVLVQMKSRGAKFGNL